MKITEFLNSFKPSEIRKPYIIAQAGIKREVTSALAFLLSDISGHATWGNMLNKGEGTW